MPKHLCSFSKCTKTSKYRDYCPAHKWQLRNWGELRPLTGKALSPEERFWSRVRKTESCWLWSGSLSNGYGSIKVDGRTYKAHRYSWELHNGTLDSQTFLDHICWNRHCVNPDHLRTVTYTLNAQYQDPKKISAKSGIKGVRKHGKGWQARIQVENKSISLGIFDNIEEASEARYLAVIKYFPPTLEQIQTISEA